MTQECNVCGEEKPLEEFHRAPRNSNGRHGHCRVCHNARHREDRRKKRAWYKEQKNRPCADCGVRYPPHVMQFDHLPEHEKEFSIGIMLGQGISYRRLKAEIAKCEVVCANCHAERTHSRG